MSDSEAYAQVDNGKQRLHVDSGQPRRPDAYAEVRPLIREIAAESGNTYGSPRIGLALRGRGMFISKKVVRRLMKEEHIEAR